MKKRYKRFFSEKEFYEQLKGFCIKHDYNYDKIADEIICPPNGSGCALCGMKTESCVDFAKAFVITEIRKKKLEKLLEHS